ncbi:MAG: cytochrome c biogenesis protein CcdA [Armatimonadota bacterium]|nr:cytochrome c biogenesis protein CcdA [Armatimonadota bacterium]MDR7427756.1 cytochrome c biogenesis protein CcdA [Armatimonadota bacterium]MDR7464223.1 cytochrome c biogenesis protein CcdA [Armatimonadota bacterium]MDR7469362.1 cytochrome c biogenesis protein CcdA [Armatimonadota bacterium]MDR7475916.1 cytochrome c biogenesis protein CcdA [Armatimonadota bacterium]
MPDVSFPVAFAAGVLGFLSPCVVPLIPGYISFVSGLSLQEMEAAQRRRHAGRVLLATGLFVGGFALVFTALGASASLLGGFVLSNRIWLSRVGGLLIIALGLAVLLRAPLLYREHRFHFSRRPWGLAGAVPVGMAFGFAWTPCIGPVLTAVLTLAAQEQSTQRGALLLFTYALGMGVPFLLAALLLTLTLDLSWLRRYSRSITTLSGVFLLIMGLALASDALFVLNTWILRLVPFRPAL